MYFGNPDRRSWLLTGRRVTALLLAALLCTGPDAAFAGAQPAEAGTSLTAEAETQQKPKNGSDGMEVLTVSAAQEDVMQLPDPGSPGLGQMDGAAGTVAGVEQELEAGPASGAGQGADEVLPKPVERDKETGQWSDYVENPRLLLPAADAGLARSSTVIPSSYDLRNYGQVTPVRNQGSDGTCWAFGAIASAESGMIKKGLANSSIDLSEQHLAWYTYVNDNSVADKSKYAGHDRRELGDNRKSIYGEGGSVGFAAETISRWYGLVDESRAKYDSNIFVSNSKPDCAPTVSDLHVKDIGYLPDPSENNSLDRSSVQAIQRCIMEKGALTISLHMDSTVASGISVLSKYYSTSNYCYYYDGSDRGSNHLVTVVGWDDNFSRDNFVNQWPFGDHRPPGNGAWLIKNSWGKSFHKNGYFWLSYYDNQNNVDGFAYVEMEDTPYNGTNTQGHTYSDIYQYDGMLLADVMWNLSFPTANKFTAREDTIVKGIGVKTRRADSEVTYSFYTGQTTNDPASGRLLCGPITEKVEYAGYHVLDLGENAFRLAKGQSFTVVASCPGMMFIESKRNSDNEVQLDHQRGQSYVRWYGSWKDVEDCTYSGYEFGNAAIKVFTVNAEPEPALGSVKIRCYDAAGRQLGFPSFTAVTGTTQTIVLPAGTEKIAFSPDSSLKKTLTFNGKAYGDGVSVPKADFLKGGTVKLVSAPSGALTRQYRFSFQIAPKPQLAMRITGGAKSQYRPGDKLTVQLYMTSDAASFKAVGAETSISFDSTAFDAAKGSMPAGSVQTINSGSVKISYAAPSSAGSVKELNLGTFQLTVKKSAQTKSYTLTQGGAKADTGGSPQVVSEAAGLSLNVRSGYTLTVQAEGSGSAAILGAVGQSGTYMKGETISLSARPEDGYRFWEWRSDSGSFKDRWSADTTFTMPERDAAATAVFTKIADGNYSMELSATPAGAIAGGSGGSSSGNSSENPSVNSGPDWDRGLRPGDSITVRALLKSIDDKPFGIRMAEDRISIDSSVFEISGIRAGIGAVVNLSSESGSDRKELQILYYDGQAAADKLLPAGSEIEMAAFRLTVKDNAPLGSTELRQTVGGLIDAAGDEAELSDVRSYGKAVSIVQTMPVEIKLTVEGGKALVPGDTVTVRAEAASADGNAFGIRMLEDRIAVNTDVFTIGKLTPAVGTVMNVIKDDDGAAAGIQLVYYDGTASESTLRPGSSTVELGAFTLTVKKDALKGRADLIQSIMGLVNAAGQEMQPQRAEPGIVSVTKDVEVTVIDEWSEETNGFHILSMTAGKKGYGKENTILKVKPIAGASLGSSVCYRAGDGTKYPMYYSPQENLWIGIVPETGLTAASAAAAIEESAATPEVIRYGLIGETRRDRSQIKFEDLFYFDKTVLIYNSVPSESDRLFAMDMNSDLLLSVGDLMLLIKKYIYEI